MSEIVFNTERLTIRRWHDPDLPDLLAVYGDAEAMRWVGDGKPITKAQCEEWFVVTRNNYAKQGYGMFAVEERASGTIVGFCGLVHPGGQAEAEIKYALARAFWGQGFASEIVPALLAYGASAHGLTRIIATVAAENHVSQRVLMKSGMALELVRINEDASVTYVYGGGSGRGLIMDISKHAEASRLA